MRDGYTNTKARPHVAPEYLKKGRGGEGKKKTKKKKRMVYVNSSFLLLSSPLKPLSSLAEQWLSAVAIHLFLFLDVLPLFYRHLIIPLCVAQHPAPLYLLSDTPLTFQSHPQMLLGTNSLSSMLYFYFLCGNLSTGNRNRRDSEPFVRHPLLSELQTSLQSEQSSSHLRTHVKAC